MTLFSVKAFLEIWMGAPWGIDAAEQCKNRIDYLKRENILEDTVKAASERIRSYGFAFAGKNVMIG